MKIAIPTKSNNQIDEHFGHCEFYTIFTISDDKQLLAKAIVDSPQGCGCKSDIAARLAAMDVRLMLAGGIGSGAVNKLASHQIEVVRNCKGNVLQLLDDYLAGKVVDGAANCSAHDRHDDGGKHVCSH